MADRTDFGTFGRYQEVPVLIGWFTMVCLTFTAFDVPADADPTGLQQ